MVELWTSCRSVSADAARGSGSGKDRQQRSPRDKGRKIGHLGKTKPTDSVYRAAILTAHDIDTISDPTRASAGVALAATLERHGVRIAPGQLKGQTRPLAGIFDLENGEGIVVSVPGDERPSDWMSLSKQNRWKMAHLVHFAPRSLSVRTVSV